MYQFKLEHVFTTCHVLSRPSVCRYVTLDLYVATAKAACYFEAACWMCRTQTRNSLGFLKCLAEKGFWRLFKAFCKQAEKQQQLQPCFCIRGEDTSEYRLLLRSRARLSDLLNTGLCKIADKSMSYCLHCRQPVLVILFAGLCRLHQLFWQLCNAPSRGFASAALQPRPLDQHLCAGAWCAGCTPSCTGRLGGAWAAVDVAWTEGRVEPDSLLGWTGPDMVAWYENNC